MPPRFAADQGAWLRPILELALQRDLLGFERGLKPVMDAANIAAWACLFPPSFSAGGRNLLIAHGVRPNGDGLREVVRQGLSSGAAQSKNFFQQLALDMAPAGASDWKLIQLTRSSKQPALAMFLFKTAHQPRFTDAELKQAAELGSFLDQCFVNMASHLEQEFMVALLRLVSNLHVSGLCVLDAKRRLIFENRKFREHMVIWADGLEAIQAMSLPKQTMLPGEWVDACDECYDASTTPQPEAARTKASVARSQNVSLSRPVGRGEMIDGSVRFLQFQSQLGNMSYLLLSSDLARASNISSDRLVQVFHFSPREQQVAGCIMRGLAANTIATELSISLPTVKTHIQNILRKAGAKTRLQFITMCQPESGPEAS